MIVRALTLAGGIAGATGLSQFPEFSQQYVQRLGGAVDALTEVVADFDASAQAEGLSREAALTQMSGTEFLERRRTDMETTFKRHERLTEDLAALRDAGPFQRVVNALRFSDSELIGATADDFRPAVPVTLEGAAFAGVGFVAGWVLLGFAIGLLLWPFRRRRRAEAPQSGA